MVQLDLLLPSSNQPTLIFGSFSMAYHFKRLGVPKAQCSLGLTWGPEEDLEER